MNPLKINSITFLFAFIVLLSACQVQQEEEGEVIASAYEFKLYLSDLERDIPDGLHGNDSLLFVQNYINRWMQEKVILHSSIENLNDEDKQLEDKVEKYRNSLLIYNYHKRFIQQNLDTIVSDQEVNEYYQSHLKDFELKDNIVKVMFIKLDKESKNIKEVKKLMKSNLPEDRVKIKDLADRVAVNYFLDDEAWLLFDDLLKEVPIKTYNQESFLKNNTFFSIDDSLYTTLVKINGFQIKNSVSPLSFEYDRISSIILNKRKLMLITRLENDLMERARNEGKLKYLN